MTAAEKPVATEVTSAETPTATEVTAETAAEEAPAEKLVGREVATENTVGGEVAAEKAAAPRARRARGTKAAGGSVSRSKAAPREHVQEELIPQEPAATVWKEPAGPVREEALAPRSEAPAPVEQSAARDMAVTKPAAERTDPWAGLIADPARAPELLAIAAVQTLGPRAREWADRTREAYPAAGTDALVRLATRQFTRLGSLTGIVGAVAGAYAPVALLGAAAFTDAELSLHIAAAYGLDPTDEERAADLLVIGRVHATKGDAIDALAEARRPAYDSKEPLWRIAGFVAAQTAAWVAVKVVNRRFPGTSLLAAFLSNTASANATAARAAKYYKSARSS
ncbi:hypothetical protein ACFY36_33975 [Actinoplanes sp. NPDC000266]